MKKLLIVESPAKIKTLAKFLGKDFKILSTVGHIKDLPPKRLGVTINGEITIEYVPIENKEKIIADICKAASTASHVYLAPDPDREGEIIAWHVEQEIKKVMKSTKNLRRITFNEITEPAVANALKQGGLVDPNKVAAQQARRVLDRWVGYEVSPLLWKKLAPGLSAGRVQSVALRLICEREIAIRNFKPEEHWTITALFQHALGTIEAQLAHVGKKKAEIKNKAEADELVQQIKEQYFAVEEVKDKERTKNPYPPFMTSSLQQAAFNRLGFSVKKTMQLAQKLYEGIPLEDPSTPIALITYMRTDSLRLSDTAITLIRSHIQSNFSAPYLPGKAVQYARAKKSKSQDAHEAIRPIDVAITPEYAHKHLPKDLARLYELIWRRSVACQMAPARYAQRQVTIKGGNFLFKATGSSLIFDGFLKVYESNEEDAEESREIARDVAVKDLLHLNSTVPKQHFTQPPPKYTEASLVKEMEKEGIGRPSTYAAILNTIQARSYTTMDAKKRFTPTELGMVVTKMLAEHFPQIMDLKFTAHMEEDLDKIAGGDLARDVCLREFYTMFAKALTTFKQETNKKIVEQTDLVCPQCEKNKLLIRFGKAGEFLGCAGYPQCSFTSNFSRSEQGAVVITRVDQQKKLDLDCPLCTKPLREVVGKFGPFIACSGYPDCKYIHQRKASFPCLLCGKGEVVERRWRGGTFWGCNNYPGCKFAIFGDIEQTPCKKCHLPFLVKKTNKAGETILICSSKSCDYGKTHNHATRRNKQK